MPDQTRVDPNDHAAPFACTKAAPWGGSVTRAAAGPDWGACPIRVISNPGCFESGSCRIKVTWNPSHFESGLTLMFKAGRCGKWGWGGVR